MNATKACRRIRLPPTTAGIPVALFTAVQPPIILTPAPAPCVEAFQIRKYGKGPNRIFLHKLVPIRIQTVLPPFPLETWTMTVSSSKRNVERSTEERDTQSIGISVVACSGRVVLQRFIYARRWTPTKHTLSKSSQRQILSRQEHDKR